MSGHELTCSILSCPNIKRTLKVEYSTRDRMDTKIWYSWGDTRRSEYQRCHGLEVKLNGVDTKASNHKNFLEAACGGVLWFLWKARNNVVFNGKSFSGMWVMDEVQASLYTWVKYRSNCNSIVWVSSCCNPLYSFWFSCILSFLASR